MIATAPPPFPQTVIPGNLLAQSSRVVLKMQRCLEQPDLPKRRSLQPSVACGAWQHSATPGVPRDFAGAGRSGFNNTRDMRTSAGSGLLEERSRTASVTNTTRMRAFLIRLD